MFRNWCFPSCEGQIIVRNRRLRSDRTGYGETRSQQKRTVSELITSMSAPCMTERVGGLYVISTRPSSEFEDEPRSIGCARRFVNEVCEFQV